MTSHYNVPTAKGLPLVGNLFDFQRDNLGFLLNMAREYGDVVRYRLGPILAYQVNQPDLIQEILVSDKFTKSALDRVVFQQSMGNGLLSSEGDFHKRQRKLAQPAFHSKRIEAYADIMIDYAQKMMDGWHEGDQRDIHDDMTKLTLFIVSKTLYDADVSNDADDIGEAIHVLTKIGEDQYKQGFVIPSWLPVPQNLKTRRAVEVVNDAMLPIIEQRRKSSEDKGDLLSMLLLAQDEDTGGQMTDQQVRDEAVSLFIAGHETTSNALSWTWYLLAQHPEVEAKLHAEVDSVLGGRMPTLRDLANMPYTDWVIKESMRLYPPAWVLNGRTSVEDVVIGEDVIPGGVLLPKGCSIFLSPYVMHRDPRYFEQPESFIPERWADGLDKRIPRYAYFPFGGGPRVCIGNQFALMEARLIVAAIASRYTLSLTYPGQEVKPDALVTLRPLGGVPMRVTKREPVVAAKSSLEAVS